LDLNAGATGDGPKCAFIADKSRSLHAKPGQHAAPNRQKNVGIEHANIIYALSSIFA